MTKRVGTWDFDEERAPIGRPDSLVPVHWRLSFERPAPDLSDCLAVRQATRPWFVIIWEPLPTKAPGPHLAQPWCCYINTVIFYHRPYIVDPFTRLFRTARGEWRPSKGGYLEWDKLDTRLACDDIVRFEGEEFELGGGQVTWRQRRWWMCRWARRKPQSAPAVAA